MNLVFADAFYWVALLHRRDAAHSRALSLRDSLATATLVTTDEVLTEVLAFSSGAGPRGRRIASALIHELLQDPTIQVVPQTREGFLAGLELYGQRLDKGYSLTDCISMNAMRRRGIRQVLTNDRHFQQEGFDVLL